MDIKYHEAPRTTKRVNPKKTTPRHTIIKLSKFEEKEL